jgi:hypothetical protein
MREKERLRSWLFVPEKFDVLQADFRDHIAPLTAFVENRSQRAVDVFRGSLHAMLYGAVAIHGNDCRTAERVIGDSNLTVAALL